MAPPGHRSAELVGRSGELDRLGELIDLGSLTPGVSHVLLSGDAGVGKTRVLGDLADRALAHGWRVVAGHCLDFGDSALSYLPFSEVVGRLTTDLPDLVAEVAGSHPALSRLQPGRRVLERGEQDHAHEETVARTDLVEAVHSLLDAAARDAPLLLVVEDAHWADRSTRELVGFLLARPFAHRVALVVSYRSDDLHRRHPLRPQIAEWGRIPGVERRHLDPLGEADVRTLVARLGPAGLGEDRVRDIVDRAEGNAFFVEELVDASADGGPGWSRDLADVLLVRLDRLGTAAREVVRAASVAGRTVGHPQLAAAARLKPDALNAGLREAVEANVLVTRDAAYSFRHALLAEAAYDDLLPGERVELHARYAAALRDGRATGTAAELARHARLAGDRPSAVLAGIRAGDEARSVGGPDEAADHYQQALRLLGEEPVPEVDPTGLAVSAAEALVDSGHPERAADLVADQLRREAAHLGDADRARLLSARAAALMVFESTEDPVAVSQEAVSLLSEEPTALRAKVLATHARALATFDRDGVEGPGLEALAVAERLNLPHVALDVRMTLVGLGRRGPRDALRASLRDAVGRAELSGATWAEVRGRYLLARSYQDASELVEARRCFAEVVELGERSGAPWAPYVLDARWHLAQISWLEGDWDGTLRRLDTTGQSPPLVATALMSGLRLTVEAWRGRDVDADVLALRSGWELDGAVVLYAAPLEAAAAGRAADVDRVVAVYDDAVRILGRIWTPAFAARLRLATITLGLLADLVPTLGGTERQRVLARSDRLLEEGRSVPGRQEESGLAWGPEGRAWLVLLEAEALRLRWAADIEAPPAQTELEGAWRAAVEAFERLGYVPEEVRARAVLAGVLRAGGDAAGSRQEADRARSTARDLGASVVLDRLRELGPAGTAKGEPDQLTPREDEILRLVAQGRSNGEIGRHLFISAKTVSVHVSNILAKLGVASRTEAAAVARRRGLLP